MKVCLSGATGFIGNHLLEKLQLDKDVEVIALSRKVSPMMDGAVKDGVTWRRCNGFSLIDVEKATQGADVLIYLIHSMLPSSALTQGSFANFDLYLADNFARAAKKNNIKKIIYLSGLIPGNKKLSSHLKSRLEVENVLGQYNNSVTTLRSGLIVGSNGSSFRILEKLVKRLPAMICPSWTMTKTQPIDLEDALASLTFCIKNQDQLPTRYDIAGPDIVSYKEMLISTAKILGKKRWMINVPFFSPGLSKLWVSRITSTPKNLVYPLVESLKYEMIADPSYLLKLENHEYVPLKQSLENSLETNIKSMRVRSIINYSAGSSFQWLRNVTSIQRFSKASMKNAQRVASEYFKWLPIFLRPIIKVSELSGRVEFSLFGKISLLVLEKCESRSSLNRVFYYIRSGILARESTLNGRLEFRYIEAVGCTVCALLDFRPSLPWFIYKYTQAVAHLFVMNQFKRHLRKNNDLSIP